MKANNLIFKVLLIFIFSFINVLSAIKESTELTSIKITFQSSNNKNQSLQNQYHSRLLNSFNILNRSKPIKFGETQENPFKYFTSKVKELVVDDHCDSLDYAYVSPFDRNQNIIHLCPEIKKFNVYLLSAALLHEASHLNPNSYSHAVCKHGGWKNQDVCDDSEESGAYGLQIQFLKNILMSHALTPDQKISIEESIYFYSVDRLNQTPNGFEAGYILRTKSNKILFYSPWTQKYRTLAVSAAIDDILTIRSSVLTQFSSLSHQVVSYYFKIGPIKTDGDYANEFRLLSKNDRKKIISIVYASRYSCILYIDQIKCGDDIDEVTQKLPFEAKHLFISERTHFNQDEIYILTVDNKLIKLPQRLYDLSNANKYEDVQDNSNLLMFTKLDENSYIGLTSSGQLVTLDSSLTIVNTLLLEETSPLVQILGPILIPQ